MIQWLFRQTWLSLRGGILSAFVSALTVAGALALVGIFAVFLFHARDLGNRWHTLSGALVYIEPGVDLEQINELQERLASYSLVNEASWVSSQDALNNFAAQGAEEAALVDGVSAELLESHFRLTLVDEFEPEQLETWLDEVQRLGFVTTVDTAAGELQAVTQWVEQLEAIGVIVAVVFLLVNGWVISNTIRIHISSRRDELEILELIGASRAAVRLPFIFQGALIGLLSGFLAAVIVEAGSFWVAGRITDSSVFNGGALVPTVVHIGLLLIGFIAGSAGSLLATTVGLGDERHSH